MQGAEATSLQRAGSSVCWMRSHQGCKGAPFSVLAAAQQLRVCEPAGLAWGLGKQITVVRLCSQAFVNQAMPSSRAICYSHT